jgi:hypothetical protein
MKPAQSQLRMLAQIVRSVTALVCAVIILPCNLALGAMQQTPSANATTSQNSSSAPDVKLSNDQLDSLVAPIALYPDPLLAQTLVACTYPLEIVQLQQWLEKNKNLKDKALTDAVQKQNWDPSIQAMAPFPDLVKLLSTNIKWTDELGNAFLAQQSDVMDAVQRMRAKAVEKGALKSNEQQKVETKTVESKTVVVVQPAKTEVVYVPSYDPVAVWGAPYYPYPPVAYPAYYPVAGMMLSFGVGVAMGAAWGGGWGWNAGWGGNNDININRNNTFVNNSNRAGNRYGGANGRWQHNPAHRGGAPYANRSTANRYGGAARGDAMSQRQTAARQSQRQAGAGTSQFRGGSSGANASAQGLNRGSGGGGGERIGNRQVSSGGGGSRSSSAFSGGGSSRSAAGASSARGASSMGRGGGGFRGGGGRRR